MKFMYFMLSCLLMCATPAQAKTSLIKAILVKVAELSRADRDQYYSKNDIGEIRFDSVFLMTLRPVQTLIGPEQRNKVLITRASAQPGVGVPYYILYEMGGKSMNVIWYGSALKGLCLDQDTANQYRVGRAVRRLRNLLPCKN